MVIDEVLEQMAIKIKAYSKEKHICVSADDSDATRMILDYLDNRNRRIPQKKRAVVISKELKDKIKNKDFYIKSKSVSEIINDFNHICNKIYNGENLNFNLSKKIFDSREKYKDMMLNAWKVYHIHLNLNDATSKNGMKRNRSSVLLFCIITDDKVMCLDIVEHPNPEKFFLYNLLRITKNNNWMEEIGFECKSFPDYVPGTLKPIITKDEDLTKLYTKYKINIAFEFDGKMFCSVDGISRTGDTSHNVIKLNDFKRSLKRVITAEDVLKEITDVSFRDDAMKFSITIIRENKVFNYPFQL